MIRHRAGGRWRRAAVAAVVVALPVASAVTAWPAAASVSYAVTATVGVGNYSLGVGLDPSPHTAYVANFNDGTVSVIDTTTNAVTATIPVGTQPYMVGVDPFTHTVYVSNFGDGTVSVIDGTTNTVTATITGLGSEPFGVGVDPSTDMVYVANEGTNTVSVITATTRKTDATCTINPYQVTYDGTAHTATGACTGTDGQPLAGLDLTGTTHTNAGTYTDTWTFTDTTGNYNNASSTVTDVIRQVTTGTTLSASANPSIVGAAVTYTAHVTSATGVGLDGGTVTSTDNGRTISGCGSLPLTSTGTASCAVSFPSVGSYNIAAAYSGDQNFASSSRAITQQVTYRIQGLPPFHSFYPRGSTVVLSLELQNASGADVSSSSIVISVVGFSPSPAPGTPPSGNFTFAAAPIGAFYQLRFKTTGYANHLYALSFTAADDPVTYTLKLNIG